jgi:hypothetical protein
VPARQKLPGRGKICRALLAGSRRAALRSLGYRRINPQRLADPAWLSES